MREGIDRRGMIALSTGHLAVDFASGSVPALIPFLTDKFNLNYAFAAMLLLASTASSSVVQPLFGLRSDRRGALWLIPGGAALAAVGVGLAAISPTYVLVLVLVTVGGIGVAAFHPEGAKFAAYASGRELARGMSYFNIGGNSGYAFGAYATGLLVRPLGLVGGLVAMLPVLLASFWLIRLMPQLRLLKPASSASKLVRGDDRRGAMALLGSIIALRSVAWFTLLAFVPLWAERHGDSKAEAGRLLFLMLLAGATGTLLIGAVADRIGLRRTLLITQTLLAPLILTFVYVGGVLGAAALMLVGMCVVGTFGVTMVLSQLYLPRHVGMASGLSIGLAMGVGGVAAVILGAVADAVDLKTALTFCALAPAVGVVLCLFLPAPAPRARLTIRTGRLRVGSSNMSTQEDGMATVQEFFAELPTRVDPARTAGMHNSFVFDVTGVGAWTVRVDDGAVTVAEGAEDADCTISANEETLTRIVNGEQNPTTAFMTGKLKIDGDMGAALKLQKLF